MKKSTIAIILLVITALTVCLFTYFVKNNNENTDIKTNGDNINYDPPTKEETKAGDEKKEHIINRERFIDDNAVSDDITVIITDAGQYDDKIEVRAFVPDYYADGTCIIKLSKGSESFSVSTPAYKDATTTTCTSPKVNRSDLSSPGKWTVQVTYKSGEIIANSMTQEISVD